MLEIDVLTLFPEMIIGPLSQSIMGRAAERGLLRVRAHQLRDWTHDRYRRTDDYLCGGGQGMLMKCEPIFEAIEELRREGTRVILMTPQGQVFTQAVARELAAPCLPKKALSPAGGVAPTSSPVGSASEAKTEGAGVKTTGAEAAARAEAAPMASARLEGEPEQAGHAHYIILCGHYEGVDQRVIDTLVDRELSIGDYILTNGAIAAVVVIDAVARLLPGALGDERSSEEESFSDGLLEAPAYTKPNVFRGLAVPEVFLSGNHRAIAEWKLEQALARTRANRPDLYEAWVAAHPEYFRPGRKRCRQTQYKPRKPSPPPAATSAEEDGGSPATPAGEP